MAVNDSKAEDANDTAQPQTSPRREYPIPRTCDYIYTVRCAVQIAFDDSINSQNTATFPLLFTASFPTAGDWTTIAMAMSLSQTETVNHARSEIASKVLGIKVLERIADE